MGRDQDDQGFGPLFDRAKKKLMADLPPLSDRLGKLEQLIDEAGRRSHQSLPPAPRSGATARVLPLRTQTDIGNAADQTSRTLSILLASIAWYRLSWGASASEHHAGVGDRAYA